MRTNWRFRRAIWVSILSFASLSPCAPDSCVSSYTRMLATLMRAQNLAKTVSSAASMTFFSLADLDSIVARSAVSCAVSARQPEERDDIQHRSRR